MILTMTPRLTQLFGVLCIVIRLMDSLNFVTSYMPRSFQEDILPKELFQCKYLKYERSVHPGVVRTELTRHVFSS